MENTKIEWTDHSWSPWYGCTKVSAGCANCYAETLNHRFGGNNWGKGKPRRKCADWNRPRRWNRSVEEPLSIPTPDIPWYRPKVFPSQCDWLDPEVPIEWLAEFLQLIYETPNLTWQLLTKRPELWKERMIEVMEHTDQSSCPGEIKAYSLAMRWLQDNPPANVWLGTSVEDQKNANERIPTFVDYVPATLRFLSVEPLLGPIEFGGDPDGIDWVIIGGESGKGARPCNLDWIRWIKDQCVDAGVPVFVKQLGSKPRTSRGNC